MKKQIIAIQGKKGSGKDEVAKYIHYILGTPSFMHKFWIGKFLKFKPIRNNWYLTRYASKLKEMLSTLMNVEINRFESRDFKEEFCFNFNNYKLVHITEAKNIINDKTFSRKLKDGQLDLAIKYDLSIRQILQFYGTDIMRKFFGDQLWVHTTLNVDKDKIIISDQRFKIENKIVSSNKYDSTIIHVVRNSALGGTHPSEKELDELFENKKYDYLIDNNHTLPDLFNQCKKILYDRNKIL